MADPSDITVPSPPPDPPNSQSSSSHPPQSKRYCQHSPSPRHQQSPVLCPSPKRSSSGNKSPIHAGKGGTGSGGSDVPGATEGMSSGSPNSSSSTPPWVVWSRGLNALLDDPQGQELFKTYLEEEGCYQQLTFLWACEGLKCTASSDPSKIPELVKKIYRVFIPTLIGLTDATKSELAQAIVEERFNEIEIFCTAQDEVLVHMKQNLYPNFLKSDYYLTACNAEESSSSTNGDGSGSAGRNRNESEGDDSFNTGEMPVPPGSPPSFATPTAEPYTTVDPLTGERVAHSSESDVSALAFSTYENVQLLQTVHEDAELSMLTSTSQSVPSSSHAKSKKHYGLTKEALEATAYLRAAEFQLKARKPEAGNGRHGGRVHGPNGSNPYHASYSSYNPASRVDSEIQSMSSDAMTDDGASGVGSRHRNPNERRTHAHEEPRLSQRNYREGAGGMDPHVLHHPPHGVDRTRRNIPPSGPLNKDNLNKMPLLPHPPGGHEKNSVRVPDPEKDPAGFAEVLIRKLQMVSSKNILAQAIEKIQVRCQDEESANDIIEKHMAHVKYFGEVTPNSKSPKLRSPTIGRRRCGPGPSHHHQNIPPPTRRKEINASTFSVDSGNVADSESLRAHAGSDGGGSSNFQVPKSRSVPHDLRSQQHDQRVLQSSVTNVRGYHQHQARARGMGGMLRKPSYEFLDSGISTISGPSSAAAMTIRTRFPMGYQAVHPGGLAPHERRVQDWITQSQAPQDRFGVPPMGPPPQRRNKKPNPPEIESVRERLMQSLDLQSSTHHLPHPHNAGVPQPRHSPPSPDATTPSSTSTQETGPFRRSNNPASTSSNVNCIPTIVSYDDDHDVPYILKIPIPPNRKAGSSGITLAVLKEKLPRQGQFRYFFTTEYPGLGSVVNEEISDDFQELPLHKGKIFAHLQATTSLPVQL